MKNCFFAWALFVFLRQKRNLLANVELDEAYHVGEGYAMENQLAPKSCKLHGIRIKYVATP